MGKINTELEYFFKAGSIIFELAKRNKVPLSMAIIDIDNLKVLNEKYGSDISNKLIAYISKSLTEKLRKSDLIAYLGEGKFGLLLYNISGINTDIVLNEIRKKIAHHRYKVKEDAFRITVSIGAVIMHPQMHESTFENMYDKASLSLMKAKKEGKNRVAVH